MSDSKNSLRALELILATVVHRGPDDGGTWNDDELGLAMGHRRLSIIDVSTAGHQPMVSTSGRYVIAFNGEIYNFKKLRASLASAHQAPEWRGRSDTEVILACIETWGIEATIKKSEGMFAFALWDRHDQALTLGRDRMGEKPLYFGWIENEFVFASELKALAAHPRWSPVVEIDCLLQFLSLGYYSGARSLVKGLFRLPAGTLLTLSRSSLLLPKQWTELERYSTRYWRLEQIAADGQSQNASGNLHESANEVERLLRNAVGRQMVADVPLGAFLSGGIDSSLIVALMQEQTDEPVKTFCIGFNDPAHDEAANARLVARHLRTDHQELYVDDQHALDLVPMIPTLFDEPLADPSQIPTLLLSRLAKEHVTVALTGDGGDELFAGYTRHASILNYWKLVDCLPGFGSSGLIGTVDYVARSNALLGKIPSSLGARLARLAARHRGKSLEALRRAHIGGLAYNILRYEMGHDIAEMERVCAGLSPLRQLLLADQSDYLTNDILMKVDRAAMSVGLETRVPMLDPAVVAFSWQLRDSILLDRGNGKRVLKEVAYRHIPRSFLDRPKQGFAPPIGLWLRGALRAWAEPLLKNLPASLESVVDRKRLHFLWQHHQAGRLDGGYALWRVLMYIAWARQYHAEG